MEPLIDKAVPLGFLETKTDIFFHPPPQNPTTDTPRPSIHVSHRGAPNDQGFVADASLHRVARHLRMMGVDCVCKSDFSQEPAKLLQCARNERRIILTTSMELLDMITLENQTHHFAPAKEPYRYFFLKGHDFRERLKQVTLHYGFHHDLLKRDTFTPRSPECNVWLNKAAKSDLHGKLEASIIEYYDEFWVCEQSGKAYYGLREELVHALKDVDTTDTGYMIPLENRWHCTFILPRSVRWRVLCYLDFKDLYSLMLSCSTFCAMAHDNLFWKWRYEQQIHTLHFSQIMQSYAGRKLVTPFGHQPFHNPDDPTPVDPEDFWFHNYRDFFGTRQPSRHSTLRSIPRGRRDSGPPSPGSKSPFTGSLMPPVP